MEDEVGSEPTLATEKDFDRLQADLDGVGSELATLKQQVQELLEEAHKAPKLIPSLDHL